jgi:hypothetical protein
MTPEQRQAATRRRRYAVQLALVGRPKLPDRYPVADSDVIDALARGADLPDGWTDREEANV